MITVPFGTPSHILLRLTDYSRLTAGLLAAGSISAGTDDEAYGQTLKSICLSLLTETLAGYSDKVSKDELERLTPELCRTLSDKLTERTGINCTVNIASLSFDDQTQELMNNMDMMRKMSDPEYAAKKIAEAEEEARKALEKQELIDALNKQAFDDRSVKGDCVPPLGTGTGGMMIKAMEMSGNGEVPDGGSAGQLGKPTQTGFIMPQATRPDVVSSGTHIEHYQPKYCPECGSKLPEFRVNFCPQCGNRI